MLNIKEWVDDHLDVLGYSRDEIRCTCPFGDCSRDKFFVSSVNGFYNCKHCDARGHVVHLVMKKEKVSKEDARKILQGAPKSVEEIEDGVLTSAVVQFDRKFKSNELPTDFISPYSDSFVLPKFFVDRGFSISTIRKYGIGYCKTGSYFDRCIIPITTDGKTTFTARIMGNPEDKKWIDKISGKERKPQKFMNPEDGHKSSYLYLYDNYDNSKPLIIVEGTFDAIRLRELGFEVMGSLGKVLSDEQCWLISKTNPDSVYIMRDPDATMYSWKDKELLESYRGNRKFTVKVCKMIGDNDPDELGLIGGKEAISRLIRSAKSELDIIDDILKGDF